MNQQAATNGGSSLANGLDGPGESHAPSGLRTRWREYLFRISLVGLGLSGGWLLAFWSLVLHARLVVGEWPHARSGNPFVGPYVPTSIDPSELGWHTDLVWLLAIVGFYVVPLTLVLSVTGLTPVPRKHARLVWALTAVLMLTSLWTIIFDPGGFKDWFID